MELAFNWTQYFDDVEAKSVELAVQDFADTPHWHYRQCHAGAVMISSEKVGALLDQIVGRVKCSCGIVLGELTGRDDGSNLVFHRVKP